MKIYFEVVDTTKPADSFVSRIFCNEIPGTDLASYVIRFAKRNNINPEEVRLYIWPYEVWKQRVREYLKY